MPRMRLLSVLLLPVLFLLMAFRQVPLVDPAPIAVPQKIAQEKNGMDKVSQAIKKALVQRQWIVNVDEPGKIAATYAPRDFSVQIGITYDRKQVQIKYLTSSNLKYEEKNGVRYIHTNYPSWVQNLVTDISGNLTLAGF